jgi:hypothetical protein
MAELIVRRRAAWYQDRMRDYIVLVVPDLRDPLDAGTPALS